MTNFVDLPIECIHKIYDMLNIYDRLNLNQALPHHLTITTTLKTNKSNNEKLILVSKSLKRRKHNKIAGKLLEYIYANHDDPTIAEIIIKYDINLPTNTSCTQICTRIKNNIIVQNDEISSDLKDYELNEIATCIIEYGSVEQFHIISKHKGIMQCLAKTHGNYLILPIIYRNINLIKHFIKNGQELYNLNIDNEIKGMLAYSHVVFRNKRYRDIVIEHIPLSITQRDLLLDTIDDDMDINTAKQLYSR